MPSDITEVQVERDQRPAFRDRDGQKPLILRAGQLLVTGQRDVVARCPQDGGDGISKRSRRV